MKTIKTFFVVALTASSTVLGGSFTWSPADSDLEDLDHHKAYEWGIKWSIPTGESITGATLTFKNIWDWRVETDSLYVNLLDNYSGSFSGSNNKWKSVTDNPNDSGNGNAFGSGPDRTLLATWSDPNGGSATGFDLVYDFSNIGGVSYLGTLQSYLANGKFAFGFDPDCHYYNQGICFTITTAPTSTTPRVPEGGSTMVLLGGAMMGLAGLRRRFVK